MTLPTDIDKQEIQNGTDAFLFLGQFQFWEVTQSSNCRVFLTIRNRDGVYRKFWSRQNENALQVIERARLFVVANMTNKQTNEK